MDNSLVAEKLVRAVRRVGSETASVTVYVVRVKSVGCYFPLGIPSFICYPSNQMSRVMMT